MAGAGAGFAVVLDYNNNEIFHVAVGAAQGEQQGQGANQEAEVIHQEAQGAHEQALVHHEAHEQALVHHEAHEQALVHHEAHEQALVHHEAHEQAPPGAHQEGQEVQQGAQQEEQNH